MSKRLLYIVLWCVCLGCAGADANTSVKNDATEASSHESRPPQSNSDPATSEPFEHESDTEYQNGLAAMMSMAPVLGAKLVTSAFRIGYVTGLEEAGAYQRFVDGQIGSLGCMRGFAAVADYAPPTEADVEKIEGACRNKEPEAKMQGARFSELRLKEAQWAGEHLSDPREVKALITIYSVGYNMGFAHKWETVDQEAHVERVAGEQCNVVVQHIQLSADQISAAASKCHNRARDVRDEYGHKLKCMLATKEMNGDLSGEAKKAGCTQ